MPALRGFRKEAEEVSAQIARFYKPERIILFGSLGANSLNPSDIDLLVIKKTREKKIKRAQEIYRNINWSLPLDLIVRTPSEVERGLKKGIPFYENALKGEVLYEARK